MRLSGLKAPGAASPSGVGDALRQLHLEVLAEYVATDLLYVALDALRLRRSGGSDADFICWGHLSGGGLALQLRRIFGRLMFSLFVFIKNNCPVFRFNRRNSMRL